MSSQSSAWAAPAPGFLTALRARRRDGNREAQAAGDSRPRVGDLIGTESGDAALIVRERWRSLVESGGVVAGTAGRLIGSAVAGEDEDTPAEQAARAAEAAVREMRWCTADGRLLSETPRPETERQERR